MVNPTQGLHALNSTVNEALKRGFRLETWVKCCRFLSTLPADLLETEIVADKQTPNPGSATKIVRLTPHLSSIKMGKQYKCPERRYHTTSFYALVFDALANFPSLRPLRTTRR